MFDEVLLVASKAKDGNITAWDIATGTPLMTYKANASIPGGLSLLGRDYFIAAQLVKGGIHAWTWHKDQVHLRSFAPEPLTSIACSNDGVYCACGSATGVIHIWDTSTGRLLRSWPAHYKSITCLAFDSSSGILIAAGVDTLVTAWILAEVLDPQQAQRVQAGGASMAPFHSWSEHTLPVTGLAVGSGVAPIVVTVSGDHTVKIRGLDHGRLLLSVALPVALTSVTLDSGEHAVYAGGFNGTIYEVSLIGDSVTQNNNLPSSSSSTSQVGQQYIALPGHTLPVTALTLCGGGKLLLSGSEDEAVRIWDVQSRQTLRVLNSPAKGPVSGLLALRRPAYMPVQGRLTSGGSNEPLSLHVNPAGADVNVNTAAGASGSGGVSGGGRGADTRKGPKRMQPLAAFAKYAAAPGTVKPWEGPVMILDGSSAAMNSDDNADGYYNDRLLQASSGGRAMNISTDAVQQQQQQSNTGIDELKSENERLKSELARAMEVSNKYAAMNAELQKLVSK